MGKHIKMKRADGEKWLAALRSGEYKQGQGKLYSLFDYIQDYVQTLTTENASYCCLGVLQHCLTGTCEDAAFPSRAWLYRHGISFINAAKIQGMDNPYLSTLGVDASIANDGNGNDLVQFPRRTFLEIADAIEAEMEYTDDQPGE